LTLAFQAIEGVARVSGAGEAQAFLSAFHAMFQFAGIAAGATAVLVAWSARRRAWR